MVYSVISETDLLSLVVSFVSRGYLKRQLWLCASVISWSKPQMHLKPHEHLKHLVLHENLTCSTSLHPAATNSFSGKKILEKVFWKDSKVAFEQLTESMLQKGF